MKFRTLLSLAACLAASGCALSGPPNRAAVVMKLSESEGHICMGVGEVKVGDRVNLYKNQCPKPAALVCEKVKIGEGHVTRLLNEHYSVMQADPGVQFQEGTTVEKKT